MRFIVLYLLLFNCFIICFAQDKRSVIEKVYSGVTGSNTITIYHRLSDDAPYHVRVFSSDDQEPRQFYVLKFESAVFNYLLVEKKVDRLLYYPLVWSDLAAVTLKDVRERSVQILKGEIKPVPKTNL